MVSPIARNGGGKTMSALVASLRQELRPMLRLALPVVVGELGWMAMGVVDTMMVGRIDAESIGAASIGRVLFMGVAIFGIGLLLGLDTLVAQAFGAGNRQECQLALLHGLYLSLIIAAPLTALTFVFAGLLDLWGVDPTVRALAAPYLRVVGWATLPILFYSTFRRYLQAMNLVRPVMIALISANLVNVFFNWVLIFGQLGFPALGVVGAAWATVMSSCYMAGFLALAALLHDRSEGWTLRQLPLGLQLARMRRLVELGIPAAMQLLLEVGVFALATVLAGRLTPVALAAHQIALNAASVTYMVPLGISAATAVRVGQALGRRDAPGAGRAGWTGLLLAALFMALAALLFVTAPGAILRAFTTASGVIAAGVSLLYVAAVFQLFDGIQVVATGALRGAGDTRTPMLWNLIGYWVLGLPVGYYLCFSADWGAVGLWIGFSIGLIVVGTILLFVWSRLVRRWRTVGLAA
jgi:MATE family multidrug resistance protein